MDEFTKNSELKDKIEKKDKECISEKNLKILINSIRIFDKNINKKDILFPHPIFNSFLDSYREENGELTFIDLTINENLEKVYKQRIEFFSKLKLEFILDIIINKNYQLFLFLLFIDEFEDINKKFIKYYSNCEFPSSFYDFILKASPILNFSIEKFFPKKKYITIYRGQKHNHYSEKCLSWTLNEEVAIWFATRYRTKNSFVVKARVPREYIWFVNAKLNEKEIVLKPGKNISKYIIDIKKIDEESLD